MRVSTAHDILLSAIESVLGRGTDVARYLTKAVQSSDALDLLLAQAAFDDLSSEVKTAIAERGRAETEQELAKRRPRRAR